MKHIVRALGTIVGIPTLIAALYFGLIASDMYVSEAKVAVRSAKGGVSVGGLSALLGSPALDGSGQDSMVVMDYSGSLDILESVTRQIDFVSHYTDSSRDILSRLDPMATQDEMLDYFRKQVTLLRDSSSDVLTVKVRAFTPEMARDLATLVIELNEQLVNAMSTRMEQDAMASAREEVDRAIGQLRKTSQDINRFQATNDSVSPQDESQALFGRLSAIEGRLSDTRAQLLETMAYMREDSADVKVLKNRIRALERQLANEKGRITIEGEGNLGALVKDFQPLVLEREIAQQGYAASLASLEAARIDAQRKKQYLITFVEPSLPDAPGHPRRLIKIITVMVYAFLFYVVFGLLWSALKDHMGR